MIQALIAVSTIILQFQAAFGAPTLLSFANCKFLDLTHTLEKGIPRWGPIDLEFTILVRGEYKDANFEVEYLEANMVAFPEHFGTHVDSPAHFFNRSNRRIDDIPLRAGIGPACVFDISSQVKLTGNPDYGLTIRDINDWEAKNGDMPAGCIALVYSGWEFKWGDPASYLGTNSTRLDEMHFPGISAEAGEYLATKKRVKAVGTDTLSLDVGSAISTDQGPFPVHYSVLGRNLLGYENLNNLHKLPALGATVVLLPLKLKDASGVPIRGLAVGWDGPLDPCRVELP